MSRAWPVGAALASVAAGWVAACVIIEPPTPLPGLPPFRPTILHASVTPKPQQILLTLGKFSVPVETLKANQSFEWNYFIDYPNGDHGDVQSQQYNDGQTIHVIDFSLEFEKPDPNTCHVIEFLVGTRLDGHSASPENPEGNPRDSRNGDIISWIYNPDGKLEGCPTYRGPDASVEDATGDADASVDATAEGGRDGGADGD